MMSQMPFALQPFLPVLAHCDPLSEHTIFVSVSSLRDDEWAASHPSRWSS